MSDPRLLILAMTPVQAKIVLVLLFERGHDFVKGLPYFHRRVNALQADEHDLNAALVSFLVTGLPIFASVAGTIGPRYRVDHDISLLVPELWCRMTPQERTPEFLIKAGHLERCADFVHEGRTYPASRLGWRIVAGVILIVLGVAILTGVR